MFKVYARIAPPLYANADEEVRRAWRKEARRWPANPILAESGFQILTDGMSPTETSSPIFDSNMPEELAARLPSLYAE
jgi:hypothetical protein